MQAHGGITTGALLLPGTDRTLFVATIIGLVQIAQARSASAIALAVPVLHANRGNPA